MEEKDVFSYEEEPVNLSGREVLAQARALKRRSEQLCRRAEAMLARTKQLAIVKCDGPTQS